MNELENQITDTLYVWHKGKDKAITFTNLATVLDINTRTLRRLISHLVTEHRIPICSCSAHGKGYFFVDTIAERDHHYNELISRSRKLKTRAYSFKEACYSFNNAKLFEAI